MEKRVAAVFIQRTRVVAQHHIPTFSGHIDASETQENHGVKKLSWQDLWKRLEVLRAKPDAGAYGALLTDLAKCGDIDGLKQAWAAASKALLPTGELKQLPAAAIIRAYGARIRALRKEQQEQPQQGKGPCVDESHQAETSEDAAPRGGLGATLAGRREAVLLRDAEAVFQASMATSRAAAGAAAEGSGKNNNTKSDSSSVRHRPDADKVAPASEDSTLHNAIIYAYCQAGRLDKALAVLKTLIDDPRRSPNPYACTGLVRNLANDGQPFAALRLLAEFERRGIGIVPTRGLYRSVALACIRDAEALSAAGAAANRGKSRPGAAAAAMSAAKDVEVKVVTAEPSVAAENEDDSAALAGLRHQRRRQGTTGGRGGCALRARSSLVTEVLRQRLDDAAEALDAMERHNLGPVSPIVSRHLLRVAADAAEPRHAERCIVRLRAAGHDVTSADLARVAHAQTAAGELAAAEATLAAAAAAGLPAHEAAYASLVRAHGEEGDADGVRRCFAAMTSVGIGVTSLGQTTFLRALLRCGHADEALEEFERFRAKGGRPERVLYNFLLHVYAVEKRDIPRLLETFEDARVACGPPDVFAYNELVNGLCKAGETEQARHVMGCMAAAGQQPDIVTYNCLIDSYAEQGRIDSALALVDEAVAKGIRINRITYRSLHKACASSGALVSLLLEKEAQGAAKTAAAGPLGGGSFSDVRWHSLPRQQSTAATTTTRNGRNRPAGGSGGSWGGGHGGGAGTGAGTARALDLHGLLVPEAKAIVLLEVAAIRAEYNAAAAADAAASSPPPLPPPLLIVTGAGRHAHANGRTAVVRAAVLEMLSERGLAHEVVPDNSGRVRVSAAAMRRYFAECDRRERGRRIAELMTVRYAVVPAMLAAFYIMPKLLAFV